MLTVLPVARAQDEIIRSLHIRPVRVESVFLDHAPGRVTAGDIFAPEMLPPFPRSTMDGFAVCSADTFGASEELPALLLLKGNILMGKEPPDAIGSGEAMSIPTGGMLPAGSDSVVMVEHCELLGNSVAVFRAVTPLENTIQPGDDFKKGDLLFSAGHRIRPQDAGILAAQGFLSVEVAARPRVVIFSTGDEVIPPGEQPGPGQVRDVNGLMLAAQVRENGGEATYAGIIPDCKDALREALEQALEEADLVIVSGGSSVGTRDVAIDAINALPGEGVLFHGVAMRPGKPLLYGMSKGKPVFGLSGNPVSAMFGFILFVKPVLRLMCGLPPFAPFAPAVEAFLATNISSPGGREDYVRVSLQYEPREKQGEKAVRARPVFGGPGLLQTVVLGDGYFVVPRDVEGLPEGSRVKVFLF
ncbi:MAG: gephyrin-like molybdotransferase Glp [Bacillota bacterium]